VTWLASDQAVYLGIVTRIFPSWCCRFMRRWKARRYAARGRRGSRVPAMESPSHHYGAAVAARQSWPRAALFHPIMGEFVIPDLLGSSETAMIGQTLWMEFFANRDWPVASALAAVLLVILVTPIVIYRQREARQIEEAR